MTSRIDLYMAGVARYLKAYRARMRLTQNQLATNLGLSLNRYREYEQNTTENAKGIALELLLNIAHLECVDLLEFLRLISDAHSVPTQSDVSESKLLSEFRMLSREERADFIQCIEGRNILEPLIDNRFRWFVNIASMFNQLPYDTRIKFEREILEELMADKEIQLNPVLREGYLSRLRELIKYYYTNFDPKKPAR